MHGRGVAFGLALLLVAGTGAWAKTPVRSGGELDQLLGPIALYPDPLLAQMLPAATDPGDLAQAAKFLEDGGGLDQVDGQPWNDNAKALARYPEVLRMMNRSRDWTNAVGAAFLDQTEDVFDSIQRLRAVAFKSGALRTTNEQRVVAAKRVVCIYPADPTAIHLPQYDADAVFALRASSGGAGLVSFGSVLLVGYWLHHELDWRKQRVYCYDYREYPYGRRNPWYHDGEKEGELPANLPKQHNEWWKPAKKKTRPRSDMNAPLPAIQLLVAPVEDLRPDEPAKPITESRPLAPPKDLPPPPPDLVPMDPELEPMEELPAAKPAKAKAAPAKTGKAATTKTKAKTAPAKTGKSKPAAAASGKAKPAAAKSAPAKPAKTAPAAKKTTPAKSTKTKPATTAPGTKK